MKRIFLLLFIAAAFIAPQQPGMAQTAPTKAWDKAFGGTAGEVFHSLQQTADGGFILGGFSASGANGDKTQPSRGGLADYWIVKTDMNGIKIWDKTFGGSSEDALTSVRQTADGGYIIGGASRSGISVDKTQASKGGNDYWVIKTDANGNKIWDKTLGTTSGDYLRIVEQTADGGYILGGDTGSGINGDKTQPNPGYWIVKLDNLGNKLWDKSYGPIGSYVFYDLVLTSDGGFLIGGEAGGGAGADKSQPSQGLKDYWVLKLDSNGNKIWDKTFGGADEDWLRSMKQTSDGGYILSGHSKSGISGNKTQASKGDWDFWLVKIDSLGNFQWDKSLGTNTPEFTFSIDITPDNGYILVGHSAGGINGDKTEASLNVDYWVIRLDSTGNKIWDKTIFGPGLENSRVIKRTSDGGYIIGGDSDGGVWLDKTQPSRGSYDYWIVKLNPDCSTISASLNADCSGTVTLRITGLPPVATGTPAWNLTYTVNGVSQTATGTTNSFALATAATPGAVFNLVSLASGTCTRTLSTSFTVPAPPAQPTITLTAPDTLVASVAGSSYEWTFNGTALPVTTRKLKATASGLYAVRVTDARNCTSAFSTDYNFVISGLKADQASSGIELYPNPTSSQVTLVLAEPQAGQVTILNALGQVMLQKTLAKTDQKVTLPLNLAKGLYLVQVKTEKQVLVKRLVVE